jgi:hypothetical protein
MTDIRGRSVQTWCYAVSKATILEGRVFCDISTVTAYGSAPEGRLTLRPLARPAFILFVFERSFHCGFIM